MFNKYKINDSSYDYIMKKKKIIILSLGYFFIHKKIII